MQRRLRNRLNFAVGLLLCQLLLSLPVIAADDRFTVKDVPVDATAGSAEEAKNKAFNDGQRQAFQQLVQTVSGSDAESAPQLSDNDLLRLVQGVEVAGEKISATRYRAKLTVSFRETRTKAFLQQARIAMRDGEAAPGSDGASTPSATAPAASDGAAPVANTTPGATTVRLLLDINNVTDWLRAKQQLQRVSGFTNLRLIKLNQSQAEFLANWNAGTGSLAEQLANNRFEIAGDASGNSNNLRLRYRP
jgi:hypothetical protein